MRRRTPQDLERIDARLVRFWQRYGEPIDYALIVLSIMALAFTFGYFAGQVTR